MRLATLGDGVDAPRDAGAPDIQGQRSLVLAADYRVGDVDRTWSLIKDAQSPLAGLGAHHAVLYTSILEPDRVLVTIGIRPRASVQELLRSPAVFEWFDRAGVNDLPAVFVGEVVEKVDLATPEPDTAAGVIVGAVSTVEDISGLMARVHGDLPRFRGAAVRKLWVYRAIDDGREVMTLLEIDDLTSAQHWIDHPDAAAEWMTSAGIGAYPRLFVGKLAYVMSFEAIRQG